ncbi:YihY/virulence factor BrkB family protein [Mycolicibacterium sp. XJ1819]
MAPLSSWLAGFAALGSTLQRRAISMLNRAPRPLRQAWRLIARTVLDSIRDRVPGLAAEVALFTLISLPALLIAGLGSLGYIAEVLGPQGTAELHRLVLEVPQSLLAERTFASYREVVEAALEQRRGSVISVGILLSVWTGSRAVNRCVETVTIAYGVEPRPAWRRRLLALGLTVAALIGAVAILPPLVLGPKVVKWLTPDPLTDTTLRALDVLFWPGIALLILVGLVTLYHVGVPWSTPWRRDIPGAVLAVVLWLVASAALRAYLAVSLREGTVYSQLAVPIAVVLWLYITALAVLLGAEFNAQIEKMWPHTRTG